MSQTTIFGETIEPAVEIETTGRTIRPFKQAIGQMVEEYRLDFHPRGINVVAVDPSNVQMLDVTLKAEALDTYDVEEGGFLTGIQNEVFGSALQHARYGKSTDDDIELTVSSEAIETHVDRELGDAQATMSERATVIDPDSVRSQPGLPNLEWSESVDMTAKTFVEVVDALDTNMSNHVRISSVDGIVEFSQETDVQQRNISIGANVGENAGSIFSADYVEAMANALQVGYADDITLRFDEEFPVSIEFERENVMHGQLMAAPRTKEE